MSLSWCFRYLVLALVGCVPTSLAAVSIMCSSASSEGGSEGQFFTRFPCSEVIESVGLLK